MLVQCEEREKESNESLSPIPYLNSSTALIDVSSFESGVSNFVERVLARLDASEIVAVRFMHCGPRYALSAQRNNWNLNGNLKLCWASTRMNKKA